MELEISKKEERYIWNLLKNKNDPEARSLSEKLKPKNKNGKTLFSFMSSKLEIDKHYQTDYQVESAIDGIQVVKDIIQDYDREAMIAIGLDVNSKVIGGYFLSYGDLNKTMCSSRELFKFALLSNSKSIIVCHNHPDGNIIPSKEDRNLYRTLIKNGDLFDIEIKDFIVIGNSVNKNKYYSMLYDSEIDHDLYFNNMKNDSILDDISQELIDIENDKELDFNCDETIKINNFQK